MRDSCLIGRGVSEIAWEFEVALWWAQSDWSCSQAKSSYLNNQSLADKGWTKITPHTESFLITPGRLCRTSEVLCRSIEHLPLALCPAQAFIEKSVSGEIAGPKQLWNLVWIKIREHKQLPFVGCLRCARHSIEIFTCICPHPKSLQVGIFLPPFYRWGDRDVVICSGYTTCK